MLCNETAFNPVQAWLSGFAAMCRSTTTVGTASIHHAQATCYACPKCTLLLYCTQQKQRGIMIKEDTHSRPVTPSGLERARLALAISAGKQAGGYGGPAWGGGGRRFSRVKRPPRSPAVTPCSVCERREPQ